MATKKRVRRERAPANIKPVTPSGDELAAMLHASQATREPAPFTPVEPSESEVREALERFAAAERWLRASRK